MFRAVPRQPFERRISHRKIAKKRQPGAGHADDHVELAGLQPLDELQCFAMVIERALLHRRRDERIAPLPPDEGFHFLGAAAFQAENAESCKWHDSRIGSTPSPSMTAGSF